MSGNNGSSLQIIESITQFVNGTQTAWNSTTVPIPAGLVIYATDTTAVKIGDGVTLYAELPILFLVSTITSLTASVNSLTQNSQELSTLTSEYNTLQAAVTALQTTVDAINTNSTTSAITTLTNQYNTLTTDYNTVQTAVTALQSSLAAVLANTNPIPGEITTLTNDYSSLLSTVNTLTTTINNLSTEVSPLPGDITTINSEIITIQSQISALQAVSYASLNGSTAQLFKVAAATVAVDAPQWGQVFGGYGASATNIATSRAIGTVYTNTTGRPIFLGVNGTASGTAALGITVNGTSTYTGTASTSGQLVSVFGVIPSNATYEVTTANSGVSLNSWVEF